jgi:hypothetical protein
MKYFELESGDNEATDRMYVSDQNGNSEALDVAGKLALKVCSIPCFPSYVPYVMMTYVYYIGSSGESQLSE